MSDREIRQESPPHASGAVRVAIALSMVAALGSVSAMFPSYFKGDYALADTVGNLLFNAPGILLLFESAVLLASARTRTFGAGLLAGFVAI